MFSGLQGWHIIVIVVAIVLLFGAKRLPDAAKGVGKSLRIFKSEAKAMREQDDTDGASTQQAQAPAAEQLPSAGTAEAAAEPASSAQQAQSQAQPSAETK